MQEMINVGVRSIHIKTTTVQVPKQSTVGQLKSKLIELEQLGNKTIRIIYHGRDLNDRILISDAGIHEGSIIHCSVSNSTRPTQRNATRGNERAAPAYPNLEEDSDSEDELTGFDRLREMGFSPDDVQQFRTQFYLNHFRNMPPGQVQPAPQSAEMTRLENQWIDAQFNPRQPAQAAAGIAQDGLANTIASQPRRTLDTGLDLAHNLVQLGTVDGNGFNLFFGLIMGFLLGLIILFWVGEPHLTRKTRLGMFFGLFANFVVGIIAYNR